MSGRFMEEFVVFFFIKYRIKLFSDLMALPSPHLEPLALFLSHHIMDVDHNIYPQNKTH